MVTILVFIDFCYIFDITKRSNNNNRFIKVTFFKHFFNPNKLKLFHREVI